MFFFLEVILRQGEEVYDRAGSLARGAVNATSLT